MSYLIQISVQSVPKGAVDKEPSLVRAMCIYVMLPNSKTGLTKGSTEYLLPYQNHDNYMHLSVTFVTVATSKKYDGFSQRPATYQL